MPEQALDGGKVSTLIFSVDGHMSAFEKSILAFNLNVMGGSKRQNAGMGEGSRQNILMNRKLK